MEVQESSKTVKTDGMVSDQRSVQKEWRGTMRKNKKVFLILLTCGTLLLAGCKEGISKEDYRMAGITALDEGRYEEAVTQFDEAIAHSNGLVGKFELDVLKYRAEAEYAMGDYTSAAQTYQILLQADEEKAEYYYFLSMAQASMGELQEAQESFEKGKTLKKDASGSSEARLVLGQELLKQGQTEEAMSLLEEVVSQGTASPALYNQIGLCYLKQEEPQKAAEAFEQGIAMWEQEQTEKAEITAEEESVRQELLFNQAVAYEYCSDFAKARELLEAYVTVYTEDEEAKRELEFLKTR